MIISQHIFETNYYAKNHIYIYMVVEILTLKSIYLIKLFKFSTALFNLQNRQLLTRTEGQFDRGIGTFVDSFVNMFK